MLLAIIFVPTTFALFFQPSGWSWTGILSRNTADVNGYLSIIEEIRQGRWLAHNLFTAENHPAFQVRPYYTILGLVGRMIPSLSNIALLEIGRLLSVVIFLLLLLMLIQRIYPAAREQFIALIVVACGSGLGWLHLTPDPPDLRIVEASTFLAMISPPLYSVSLSLFTAIVLALHSAWKNPDNKWKYGAVAAFCALWEGFDRPFLLAPLLASVIFTSCYFVYVRRRLEAYFIPVLLAGFGAALALSYQAHSLSAISVYSEWNRQHYLRTPGVLRLLLSYGLLFPLAIAGVPPCFKRNPEITVMLVSYVLCSWILAHSPIQFQERFLEASPLCISLLASAGIFSLVQRIAPVRLQTAAFLFAIAILIPSSLSSILRDVEVLKTGKPPQYLPDRFIAAMKELRIMMRPGEAVLSANSSGNFIPAYSGRQVVIGHQIQTANFFRKIKLVDSIFHTKADDPKSRALLRTSQALWLFWGPEERTWAARGFDPDRSAFCKLEFSNGLVRIYRVVGP